MRKRLTTVWLVVGALPALIACARTRQASAEAGVQARVITTPLYDAQGREVGTVTARQRGATFQVRVTASSLPAGTHGAHLHDAGECVAPSFLTAGPHLNPTARQHGTRNPNGPHLGDLPNLVVGSDRRGTMEASVVGSFAPGVAPISDANGTALIVHAGADDMVSDPSGNSGARIACAVLAAPAATR
jgi:Cu-Zn family superoxide dismutase